jgi:hypothetical protein
MAHDTGSSVLTIYEDELTSLFGQKIHPSMLVSTDILTPGGMEQTRTILLQLRIVTADHQKTVLDWKAVKGLVRPQFAGSNRLSPNVLEKNLFACTSPHTNSLYVARSKTALFHLLTPS